jgi:GNAT superfamily N-acetyltransferase
MHFVLKELSREEIPRLQEFFVANPEYFLAVEGRPAAPDAGQEAYEATPPAGWSFDRKYVLGIEDASGSLLAMADILANLFAKGVWHVGLYIVATSLHGSGAAREIYESIESWMKSNGARWARLGVVVGNERAERFWKRMGYVEVRQRLAIPMGDRINDIRVMMKPLSGGSMDEYLALVERDRLEST